MKYFYTIQIIEGNKIKTIDVENSRKRAIVRAKIECRKHRQNIYAVKCSYETGEELGLVGHAEWPHHQGEYAEEKFYINES